MTISQLFRAIVRLGIALASKQPEHVNQKEIGGDDRQPNAVNHRLELVIPQAAIDAYITAEKKRDIDEREVRDTDTSRLRVEAATLLFVIVATGASFVTLYQTIGTALTMESNRIAKESLEAGQRAYIAPSSPFTEINVIGKEEPRIDVAIPWHNDGPTPAVDAIHYFWAGELPSGLSDKHFFPGCPSVGPCMPEMAGRPSPDAFTSTFIGGKADVISRRVFWRYSFLFDTSLLATHHLDKNLFAIGWVAYRDVFPDTEPHLTQTCNSVSSYGLERLSNGQRRVNIKWATDGCGRHNCIDRQCSTYDAIVAMLPPRK